MLNLITCRDLRVEAFQVFKYMKNLLSFQYFNTGYRAFMNEKELSGVTIEIH